MSKSVKITCSNIFQAKEKKEMKEKYTQKWVELINLIEKNK